MDKITEAIFAGLWKLTYWSVAWIFILIVWFFRWLFRISAQKVTEKRQQGSGPTFSLAKRFEHMHIVAGTGHGKTQLLQWLICEDLADLVEGKASIIVIDSQADLLKNILSLGLMKHLKDRIILIDPYDVEHPPALNLFDFGLDRTAKYSLASREQLLNSAVALYEYLFGALLGAELTTRQGMIFRYLARLLLVVEGANI